MTDRELLEMAAAHEALAKKTAQIIGQNSAAQLALNDLAEARKTGAASIYLDGKTWVVVRAAANIGRAMT